MRTFTIDAENNIIAFGSKKEAAEAGSGQSFTTRKELDGIIDGSPASRLVEIWNGLPGVKPVKKFENRKLAIGRIWKAIQSLGGPVGVEKATAALRKGRSPKKASRKEKAAKTSDGSKKAKVIALLERASGATLKELMAATEWQAHSVRGFISGSLVKKMGLKVQSAKREDGERSYSLAR